MAWFSNFSFLKMYLFGEGEKNKMLLSIVFRECPVVRGSLLVDIPLSQWNDVLA